jgi:hypothetical protein
MNTRSFQSRASREPSGYAAGKLGFAKDVYLTMPGGKAARLSAGALFLVLLLSNISLAQSRQLWVYCPTNLLVDANVDKLDQLWHRAAAAGYSHVLIADSKFARLDLLDSNTKHYFANVERTKSIARKLNLQLIPAVFDIGYSNDLLGHNPNLAEGLPVKNTLFVVQNGEVRIQPDPPVAFGRLSFKDDSVELTGNTATVHDNPGNARLVYQLALPRFRCYHISVKVRTQDYHDEPRIEVLADDRSLQYQSLGVKPTQDWTNVDVVFDTLDHDKVNVYFGEWGGGRGTLQWRDWKIEEAGLVNVLRRPGTPCVVDGYVEGKDYQRIEDPKLGNSPWAGEYTAWHQPPVIKTKTIPDGTRLRVSWYFPPIVGDGQVSICPSEPQTLALLTDQAKRMKTAFAAPGYMMSHDEIRCWNQDQACQDRHEDAGQILAENAKFCVNLLSGSQAYVWSDMFDPFHNAHGDYYLVRGNYKNSWDGLNKNVIIVNWNFEHRDESLKFFADRGNKQIIAGYYDGDVGQIRDWLASANKVNGVIGVMYTTWQNKYDDLEAFAKLAR